MKNYVLGLIIGLLIGITGTVYASSVITYTAVQANFPVLVNGKLFNTDKPIVTINDSTYLPLRAIGEALGIKVNWNSAKGQVEIGETSTVTEDTKAAEPKVQEKFIASKGSDKFHYPTCRWAVKITGENAVYFNTADEARKAGYKECGTCKPE